MYTQVRTTQTSTADFVIMAYSESIQLSVNMYFYSESTSCNIDMCYKCFNCSWWTLQFMIFSILGGTHILRLCDGKEEIWSLLLIYSSWICIGISFSNSLQLLSYFCTRIKHTRCIMSIFILYMLYFVGHLFAYIMLNHWQVDL